VPIKPPRSPEARQRPGHVFLLSPQAPQVSFPLHRLRCEKFSFAPLSPVLWWMMSSFFHIPRVFFYPKPIRPHRVFLTTSAVAVVGAPWLGPIEETTLSRLGGISLATLRPAGIVELFPFTLSPPPPKTRNSDPVVFIGSLARKAGSSNPFPPPLPQRAFSSLWFVQAGMEFPLPMVIFFGPSSAKWFFPPPRVAFLPNRAFLVPAFKFSGVHICHRVFFFLLIFSSRHGRV